MPQTDLAELRRLHEAATKGDWYDSPDGFVDVAVSKTKARQVARAEKAKDAQFIAAAHNALPALLDELEKYKTICGEWSKLCEEMSDHIGKLEDHIREQYGERDGIKN